MESVLLSQAASLLPWCLPPECVRLFWNFIENIQARHLLAAHERRMAEIAAEHEQMMAEMAVEHEQLMAEIAAAHERWMADLMLYLRMNSL